MTTTKESEEKVLVIVLAETRAHEHTFELFKENLLDVVSGDLCLCVANNTREEHNPFYHNAKYVWTYEEPEDWGDAFDDIQDWKEQDANWRRLLEIKDQWLGGVKGSGEHPGSAGILLFFRIFLRECLIKHKLTEKYDRFIVTRSDFIHKVPHVPLRLLAPECVWIPNGEDYGGYTDRHMIANSKDILDVLAIADRILEEPEKLYQQMQSRSDWNLERFIKFSLDLSHVSPRLKRYPYTMYSVRSSDGHTRWASGEYSQEHGYYIKYPGEYVGAMIASKLVNSPKDWNTSRIYIFNTLRAFLDLKISRSIRKRLLKLRNKIAT